MTKRILAIILVCTLLALTLYSCSQVKAESPPVLTAEQQSSVDRRFGIYLSKFSGVTYAVYGDEVIFDGGSGEAGKGVENASDIAFGVASVTKQFTAASVMQLYEKGKLDLNDKVSKYFPDYAYGNIITVHQLLCQRSGIPDYSVYSDGGNAVVYCDGDSGDEVVIYASGTAQENRKAIRELYMSQKLLFKPGTEFDYSDSNYALLAEIIEQASGVSYHEYVRKNIFEPLGMTSSAFIDDNDLENVYVAQTDDTEFEGDYFSFKSLEFGCGDILTTARDLYTWYRAFVDGEVVSFRSYKLMTDNYSSDYELGYGYGLMIGDDTGTKAVYHYGYIPSYYSSIYYLPDLDYFQVTLSNHSAGSPQLKAYSTVEFFGRVIGADIPDIS